MGEAAPDPRARPRGTFPFPEETGARVRTLGGFLFVLVLAEGALGVASAGNSTPLLVDAHVGFGVVLVVLGGWATVVANRSPRLWARRSAQFTFGGLVATAVTGTVFLLTGFAQGASVDRGLALATLAGCVLMIVFGSANGR